MKLAISTYTKTLKEMRNDLLNIADDVELAAKDAKHHPEQLKEISKYVSNISGKVGVVQDLEKLDETIGHR